jgi:hypothetical protein
MGPTINGKSMVGMRPSEATSELLRFGSQFPRLVMLLLGATPAAMLAVIGAAYAVGQKDHAIESRLSAIERYVEEVRVQVGSLVQAEARRQGREEARKRFSSTVPGVNFDPWAITAATLGIEEREIDHVPES